MLMPFIDNGVIMWILLFVLLFNGSVAVPILLGCMLSCVSPEMRPAANSIQFMATSLIGFAPAPTVWGMVQSATGGKKSRWGLVVNNSLAVVIVILTILIYLSKYGKKSS